MFIGSRTALEGRVVAEGRERRRAVRVRRAVGVRLVGGGCLLAGRSEDLSVTGMGVQLSAGVELVPGAVLTVTSGMTLGGGCGLMGSMRGVRRARVVWVRRGRASTRCGLEFVPDITADLAA